MTRPLNLDTDLAPGDLRLLHDLAVLQIVMDVDRVPARERLKRELGPFVAALARRSLLETTARAA
jgi:hypothetical protein